MVISGRFIHCGQEYQWYYIWAATVSVSKQVGLARQEFQQGTIQRRHPFNAQQCTQMAKHAVLTTQNGGWRGLSSDTSKFAGNGGETEVSCLTVTMRLPH